MAKLFFFLHRLLRLGARLLLNNRFLVPRLYTNDLLKKYAPKLKGSVVNVSGWDDRDGEGDYYKNYFTGASSYLVTNAPSKGKGEGTGGAGELLIDLNQPLPAEMFKAYDVIYNNTTLEHVFNFEQAFKNLCDLAKEVVIIVVPVIQQIHIAETYGDYWRPTTLGLAKLFKKNGFEPLVIKTNDQPFQPIYCFALAVRNGTNYSNIKPDLDFEMGGRLYGSSLKKRFIDNLID